MSWKKFTTADKKKITADWYGLFPSLGVYKPMHLLNRVGPLLVGILLEVKSGNESYIPTFHVHNLARSFPVVSLGLATTLNKEYVHLEWHEQKYQDLAQLMIRSALIPFDGDLKLDKVIEGFKEYAEKPTFPYQSDVYEDIVLIGAWCGNRVEVQKGLEFAKFHMRNWPELVLSRMGGLDQWLQKVEEKSRDRENLIAICERQSIELKVDKLPIRRILS